MRDLNFERIFELGMGDLDLIKAAVLVDREGEVVALAGDLLEQEATPLIALVMQRTKDVTDRLFGGEIITISDESEIVVAVARRQLFLIAITRDSREDTLDQVRTLRDHAAKVLANSPLRDEPVVIWNPGGDESGHGLANLPLIEYSFDAVRPRAKA
jgi:hypothetical protein